MPKPEIHSLLEQLDSPDAEVGWEQFLDSYSPLIFQIVRLFERDDDRVGDSFLFVCKELRRNGFRRLRRFHPGGPATFETWLRAVTRNLCIDWRRKAFGRSRLFKAIDELPAVEQQVFRCTYHLGLTALETHRTLTAEYPSLTEAKVDEILAGFHRDLSSRQQWLASTRRSIEESLEAGPAAADEEGERPLPADDPTPEALALGAEDRARLAQAMSRLPARPRLALRLRFEQDLSLMAVARLMDLAGPQGAARELERALAELKQSMEGGAASGGDE